MAEYIEREAAIAAAFYACPVGNTAYRDVYDTVSRIRLIPAADVKPVVRGKWEVNHYPVAECQVCKHLIDISHLTSINFCPNCGADMRG